MRINQSLRFRLTAWYCFALSGGLVLFGLLLFTLARRNMLRHYDQPLKARAEKVIAVLEAHETSQTFTQQQLEDLDQIGRNILFEPKPEGSTVMFHWPEMTRQDLELQLQRMDLTHRNKATYETLEHRGIRWRIYSSPFRLKRGRVGWVLIVEDLRDLQAMIRRLLLDYISLALIGILVSFFGSYWLSGRGLAPLLRITEMARAIEASNLHERLPVSGMKGEIGALVKTLNRMFQRLDTSFETMQRFTADASHELRSPLATVRNTIDVTLEQARTVEEHEAALHSLGEEVDRIRSIVEDLLLFARADSGRLIMRMSPIGLDGVVEAQVEARQFQAEERHISLKVASLIRDEIEGDERWLHQVLGNLLDNALKFTPAGGTVTVDMKRRGAFIQVMVHDTGPGIPEEDLTRIFDRFFRSDPSRSRANVPGVGLGLSIVAWVVREHDGTVQASNRPEGGATFTLEFPREATRV